MLQTYTKQTCKKAKKKIQNSSPKLLRGATCYYNWRNLKPKQKEMNAMSNLVL